MSRAIRKLLHMASNGNVQNLWDDISFYYSKISYPHIHEIENLMRKLITKFMLTNVGLSWAKDTIPEDIRKSPRQEKSGSTNNYLYEIDFIQLSDFLFSEYRTLEISALIKKISEIKTQTVEMSEISDFIPKSNWKRYFEPHVDCDATYLESRWKRLYELRCKIAHNNAFSKTDHELTIELSKEVKEKLEKAIQSLDAISVPEEEREELVESVIGHANQEAATIFNLWWNQGINSKNHVKNKSSFKRYNWHKDSSYEKLLASVLNNDTISDEIALKLRDIQKLRNQESHNHLLSFDDESTLRKIEKITQELNKRIDSLEGDNDEETP